VSTLLRKFLTIDDRVRKWRVKNSKIGNVFASALEFNESTGKWIVTLDPAHQIGISTLSRKFLTVDEGICRQGIKNREFGYTFAPILGTSRDTGEWTAPLDLVHQIGISTLWTDILIMD